MIWDGKGVEMERLTTKLEDGRVVLKDDFAYVMNTKHGAFIEGKAVDKLVEYEDAEEQGLLLRLPCKVGDTVYYPEVDINYIYPVRISKIIIFDSEIIQYEGCFFDGNGDPSIEFEFDYADFEKTVFLTKEEAEKELERLKNNE